MHIHFHEYQLQLRHGTGYQGRQGTLLRVDFDSELRGYADCHPWPTLGDLPLNAQLEALSKGQYTPLTKRSLHYARLDAEARRNKVSLFDGLTISPSHFLVSNLVNEEIPEGFSHVKVKLGSDLSFEVPKLKKLMKRHPVRYRLDFNGKISEETFVTVLKQLEGFLENIEFCEDPFPYNPQAWQKVQSITGVSLAADRQSELALAYPQSCRYLIVKPAIQDPTLFLDRNVIFTSYLDHAFGQLCACYEAAKAGLKHPCGLMTHLAYASDTFFRKIGSQGNLLVPPKGTGFGFDEELQQIKWRLLN